MISLEDFKTTRLTFELRFDSAPALWDAAGAIWTRMLIKHPELRLQGVQPNVQAFESKDAQATVELGLLRINTKGSHAFKLICELSENLVEIVVNELALSGFTRAGYRSVREYTEVGRKEAVQKFAHLAPRTVDAFENQAATVAFSSWRRYENESSGLLARFEVDQREINIDVPWEVTDRMQPFHETVGVVTLDADYYTVGLIARGSFNAAEWIKQSERLKKKFWSDFLA